MSRTIRIKNNYRKAKDDKLNEYGVRNGYPWKFQWVNGDKLDRDPKFDYLVAEEVKDKLDVWKTRRWYHSDGRSTWSLGYHKPSYQFKVRNRADRKYTNRALRTLVSKGYEDVYLGCKASVNPSCW